MPDTIGDYVGVLHEIERAKFFGTVPNYLANLEIEKTRMEGDNPSFASNPGLQTMVDNRRASNKFGVKRGSPNKEV
jgi:hypothetical protein